MRLAVISDIHGNVVGLEAVLAAIRRTGVDFTINLGDCVTSPLWPRETLELLEHERIPTVRGNHDRWLTDLPPDGLSQSILFTRATLTDAQRRRLAALIERATYHDRPDWAQVFK